MNGTATSKDRHSRMRSRRLVLAGLAATLATPAAPAVIVPRRTVRGIRRLRMISIHTGERIDAIYQIDGRYVVQALAEIDWFMRDWRVNQAIGMDVRAIDIWSDLHRALETDRPFELVSGYRSTETNARLRASSPGVARKSLHISGKAADLRLGGRSLHDIARAAAHVGAGGVGTYIRSNFVHVDSGAPRRWEGQA